MSSPADHSRSFFAARHLVTRTRRDGDDYCVDLVNASGGLAASQYGRGASEETALFRAMKRYQVEQADWDQEGIEIAVEFAPTITTSAAVRQIVISAFTSEGLDVSDYLRPSHQLDAERLHPEWRWASPSLTVHLVSDSPIDEVVDKVTLGVGVALATVRRQVPNLPLGVAFDRTDQSIHLAFKHDDAPNEMATALEHLPRDLMYRKSLGWDRDRGIWFDL